MKDKGLKIAMIEPIGGHGGFDYYDFGLCGGLRKSEVDVTLYTCEKTKVNSSLPFDVKLYFKGIYGDSPKFLRALRYIKGLNRSLIEAKKNGVKIAHFHFCQVTILEFLSIYLTKFFGMKIVITAHDVESFANQDNRYFKNIYHKADLVIAHNQISKKELMNKLHLPYEAIAVLPHGNYMDSISSIVHKSIARKNIGVANEEGPYLLFFGQIKKVKGLELLIHAMPKVVEHYPKVKLIIAGKLWKNDFEEYSELINKYGIGSNVISHIKYIPNELVDFYYQAADLVVLPYRKIYQSGVVLHAMTYNRPVLVSNIEGMTELVKENDNGFTFKSDDYEDLSNKLIEILSNPQKMQEISIEGYKTVTTKHSWDYIGQETAKVYKSLA